MVSQPGRVTFAQPVVVTTQHGVVTTPSTVVGSGCFPIHATVSTPVSVINSLPVYSSANHVSQPTYPQYPTSGYAMVPPLQWIPMPPGPIINNVAQQIPRPVMMGTPTTGVPFMSNETTAPPSAPSGTVCSRVTDILAILPEFDPTNENSLTSSQFVQRVQVLKNAYQWRDDLVFGAQQKVKGHAKLWVDAQREVFVSWAQFAQCLVRAFPFEDNAAEAHMKLASTKRLLSETPQAYYFKMLALGTKYGLHENAIARHIINGINEENLRRKISNEYTACVDLLRDLENYCRYNDVRRDVPRWRTPQTAAVTTSKGSNQEKREERQIKCYNCGKLGHISTKCPEPRERCKVCGKTNHLSKDCPNLRNKGSVNLVNEQQLTNSSSQANHIISSKYLLRKYYSLGTFESLFARINIILSVSVQIEIELKEKIYTTYIYSKSIILRHVKSK